MARARGEGDGGAEWRAYARANRAAKRACKVGAYLSEDALKRLKTAALVEDLDRSEILEALVRTHLVGYYSGLRQGPAGQDEEAA